MSAEVKQEQQAAPEKEAPKSEEINIVRVRKLLEQEKAARAQAEARLAEMEKQKQPVKEDDDESSDEPYVDHRQLNKKLAKFEQSFEKKVDALAEQKARSLMEQEKQQNYVKQNPDFTQVLTEENIQKFAEKHPSIAERMLRMPDNFDRQALLYEQMKALQTKKEDKPSIQDTIDKNRKSPYYQPSNVGTAPYATVGDFSEAGQKNAYAKLKELKSKLRI